MIIESVFINGEAYELTDLGDLKRELGEAWEISGSGCSVVVIDDDMLLFNAIRTLPEGEVIILEIYDTEENRVFIGDCDPAQCDYDEESETTSLQADNLFSRIKGTVVQDETWKRAEGNTYTVTAEAKIGEEPADWILLDHVANIFPDDELEAETIVNRRTRTEKMKVLYTYPESGKVMLSKKLSTVLPVDTVVTRTNNEARFISVQDAVDRLNQDIEATGSVLSRPLGITGGVATGPGWMGADGVLNEMTHTVVIENQTSIIVLEEEVTAPYPIPTFNDVIGSIRLMTGTGVDDVIARFVSPSDTGVQKQVIEFGTETAPVLSDWLTENFLDFASMVDWTPHVSGEPVEKMAQYGAALLDAFDYPNLKRYRIEMTGEGDEYGALVSHDWAVGLWGNRTVINADVSGPSLIYNTTYDHVNSKLYCTADDRLYQINRGNGLFTDLTGALTSVGEVNCLSLAGLLLMSAGQGELTIFDINNALAVTTIKTKFRPLVASAQYWNGRLYFLGSSTDETRFFCYELIDGDWSEVFSDLLVSFQAENGRIIQRASLLFIELHGLLFTYSKKLLPVLPKADVFGMTVGDVARNLAFFADAMITEDAEGIVWITPKTSIQPATVTVTEADDFNYTANWSEQYQRIVVQGDSDAAVGAALTTIPGETWELSKAPFVTMASHAKAIAMTLLSWHKYKRRPLEIISDQLDGLLPLNTFNFQGAMYRIQAASIKLETASVTGQADSIPSIKALEVLSHEIP